MAEPDLVSFTNVPAARRHTHFPGLAIVALAWCGIGAGQLVRADELDDGFGKPPNSAKPQTWWHWLDGNISQEGIVAELEAIQRIGVGGVQMFTEGNYPPVPNPTVPCLSPKWHEMVRLALKECDRLGLQFAAHNCAGWSAAGGPWITPDKGMFHVVSSKQAVAGGATVKLAAPPTWPETGNSYYRDIAVLAFPTPEVLQKVEPLPTPKITGSFAGVDLGDLSHVPSKRDQPALLIPAVPAGGSAWIDFEFPSAVTCRSVTINGLENEQGQVTPPDDHRAVVWASDDGQHFHEVCRLATFLFLYEWAGSSVPHAIPPTKARFFRLAWDGPASLRLRHVAWSAAPVIDSHDSKIGEAGRTLIAEPSVATEAGTAVPTHQILDLSNQLDAQGNLSWTAPPGDWTVVRSGFRNTGWHNAPAPKEADGLECDKFSRDVVAYHFDQYIGGILKDAAMAGGKAMTGVVIDSYEARIQNWSPTFRAEFRTRRGYDVLNYMPTFAGFIVGDRETTDRFLRDVRQTGSDLISEAFYGVMTAKAREHNLQLYAESCGGTGAGTAVADCLQPYLQVDIPMTEGGRPLKPAPSAAHVAGKKIVAMEAFTEGGGANWDDSPASLKAGCDSFLWAGVNRLVFQAYAHNPEVAKLHPGPAFWKYGMPFSRGQTWWEMGHAWMTYLSRCQFLLQRGNPTADVLYFYGEDPAGPVTHLFGGDGRNPDAWSALPRGLDYDMVPAEALVKGFAVRDGKLVTANGTAYRLLVLRDSDRMTPETATKIKELVAAGATVCGPKPQRSPSLSNYPQCDPIVSGIGNEVWGDCDGKTATQHAFGRGRVFCGLSLKATLAAIQLPPDFSYQCDDASAYLRFIHRRDGDAEIYFVANQGTGAVKGVELSFRVVGKQPELWDPVTGQTRDAATFHQEAGRTHVPWDFEPQGSIFVVFRRPIAADASATATGNSPVCREPVTLANPWNVSFTPGWGAPESVRFETLADWSRRPEPGIKYYSGTAVYRTTFDWNAAGAGDVMLDLGDVAVIAGVKLNGVDCGVAWTPPYRLDITHALRPGPNELEVRVANTWANRLIGDEHLAPAARRTWTTYHSFTKNSPLVQSGLLGPVTIQPAQ